MSESHRNRLPRAKGEANSPALRFTSSKVADAFDLKQVRIEFNARRSWARIRRHDLVSLGKAIGRNCARRTAAWRARSSADAPRRIKTAQRR